MKKATLFAVIGFGLIVLACLWSTYENYHSSTIFDNYPMSQVISALVRTIGFGLVETFFIILYSKQK